jgi:hypothetical protein
MAGKNQIGYNDLFNESGRDIILTAIRDLRDLRDSYKDFIAFVSGNQIAQNNAAMASLAKEIEGVAKASQALNITNERGQKALADNLKLVERLRAENEALRASKAGAGQAERALAGSVDFLTQSYKEQLKAYRALGVANEADRMQREKMAATIRETRKEINQLNEATKATTKIVQYAKGSYGELNAQTKQYEAQIKRLGGAFDGTNPKVAELQAKIHANTAKMKEFDAAMNQNFRNVGNYKSAFNSMGNSVNQLTRELPAFTNSVQTGFLAISNNLPILADSITELKNKNAALRAEGQPTVSVFKSIAGAVFSWGTAISLGITLLTVYGKDIVGFIGKLFHTADAMEKVRIKQELLNDLNKEANHEAGKSLVTLQILYTAATNLNSSYKDRLEAVKGLKKEFPDTFKNMSNEYILTGKAKKANDELKQSIMEVAKAEAARGRLAQLASEKLDIEVQKSKIRTAVNNEKGRVKPISGKNFTGEKVVSNESIQERLKYDLRVINDRGNKALAEEDRKLQEIGFKEKVIFDFVNAKALVQSITNKGKKEESETLDELIRKQDELLKASQAYEISQAELRFSKSGRSFDDEVKLENERLAIIEKYGKLRIGIYKGKAKEIKEIDAEVTQAQSNNLDKLNEIQKRRIEEQKKLLAERDKDIQEISKNEIAAAQENYERSAQQYSDQAAFENAKLAILNKSFDDRLALYAKDSDEYRNVLTEKLKAENDYSEKLKAIQEGRYAAEAALRQAVNGKEGAEVSGRRKLRVAKGEITQDDADSQERASRLIGINLELDAKKEAIKFLKEGDKDYLDTQREIADLEKALIDDKYDHEAKAAQKVHEKKKALQQAALDFATEAGGKLFDLGRQLNESNINQLEKDKERELQVAGNNTAARAAIEEKFQQRIIALKRKQAVYDKVQALFDVGINTAIAVSKATASSPLTFGQPWATYAIIQGGIQAAAILAKPLPKYAKGRRGGPAEFAEVNEQGAELLEKNGRFRFANKGKHGVAKLEPGETVHTAEKTKAILSTALNNQETNAFVNSLLSGTGVVSNYEHSKQAALAEAIAKGSLSEEVLERVMKQTIGSIKIYSTSISERGIHEYTQTSAGKIEHLNNRNKLGANG